MEASVSYLCYKKIFNATKIYQFKAKDSEPKRYTLCLENISGTFSDNKMKKTRLNGWLRDFDASNFTNIHKY